MLGAQTPAPMVGHFPVWMVTSGVPPEPSCGLRQLMCISFVVSCPLLLQLLSHPCSCCGEMSAGRCVHGPARTSQRVMVEAGGCTCPAGHQVLCITAVVRRPSGARGCSSTKGQQLGCCPFIPRVRARHVDSGGVTRGPGAQQRSTHSTELPRWLLVATDVWVFVGCGSVCCRIGQQIS